MSLIITEKVLLPIRRDKQIINSGSTTLGGGGGGGTPIGMIYPDAGIAKSTGTAWGTSYTTSGSGTILALVASPVFTGDVSFDTNTLFIKSSNHRVGILTTSPGQALSVNGEIGILNGNNFVQYITGNAHYWNPHPSGNDFVWNYDSTELARLYTTGHFELNGQIINKSAAFAWKQQNEVSVGGKAWVLYTRGANPYPDTERLSVTGAEATAHWTFVNSRISLDGGLHVGGTSDPGADNLWIDGIAQEPSFASGWQGNNWQIQADGDAEFNNVLIRGGLSVYELIINQLHYQNGGLIIGAGAGKIATIETSTKGSEVLTFHDPEGNDMVPFTAGSIVVCQRVDISKTVANGYTGDIVKKIVRQVASVSSMEVTFTTTAGWTTGDDTGIFEIGDELVAVGHTSNTSLDSCIYMSATDSDNPFLRVMDGISTYGKWALGDKSTIKLQIGNLASLASYDILPASPGYGLYSDNVYLKGLIQATSGLIGSWNIDSGAIYTGTKHDLDDWSPDGITLGASGSLHSTNLYVNDDGEVGMRGSKFIYAYLGVSDTVILSHDAVVSTTAIDYTKKKTITLGADIKNNQTLRIKFDLSSSDGDVAYGKIYRNGTPVGTEQSDGTDSYVTKTEDITGWNAGDTLELWIKTGTSELALATNLKVCGTHSVAVNEVTGVNS